MPTDESTLQPNMQNIFRDKCMRLTDQLSEARRKDDEHPGHFFVPLGEIERILSEKSLYSLLQSWEPQPDKETIRRAIHTILERKSNDDLGGYRFLRVFATLIYSGNEAYITGATACFLNVDSRQWQPPEDASFPSSNKSAKEAFYKDKQDDGFFERFFDQKKYFCALILKEGGKHEVHGEQILPFLIEDNEKLGNGAAGTVYKVKVAKRHWQDKGLSNPQDIFLAIKKFDTPSSDDQRNSFENEFKNLMELKNASIRSENVMLPLASLIHGEQRYLIYDLAETQLQDYIWDTTSKYTFSSTRTKAVLKNATDLVGALHWIHQYKPYHQIWHGDIKPDNILILRRGSRELWKLADFDRSRAKTSLSESGSSASNPTDRQIYRAPEVVEGKGGKRNDVWAMACMIVLILSWLDNGPESIGQFSDKRRNGDPAAPDFFGNASATVDGPNSENVLNPMVKEWLGLLCEKASEQTSDENTANDQTDDLIWYSKAVRKGFQDWVEKLLDTGNIDLDLKNSKEAGLTPVILSCQQDRLWAAKLLIDAGATLDIEGDDFRKMRVPDRIPNEMKKYIKEKEKKNRKRGD
ncbi:hypothetical protein N0V90_002065 [Kalmusia sp. IMI 367209]|nr:hypothetical protein N0V90_002065 [Kalmusia sp. IMI 367209]